MVRSASANKPMLVASTQYNPKGLVFDYLNLSGSATSYTFTNNSTYHIASSFSVGSGAATFQQNACIKLDTNAYLLVSGNVSCSSSGLPTVVTSSDDNGFGDRINGSTANPGYAAAEGIWMYFQTVQTFLQNLRVRWAQIDIRYDDSGTLTKTPPQLTSSALEDSTTGIYLNIGTGENLGLSQDTYCNVATPINFNHGGVSGTIVQNCGVVTVAMVNDPSRDLYDYDTNKNSQSECSFAVLDSTNIVAAFMNTHLSEYGLASGGVEFPGIPSPRMTSWAVSANGGTSFTDKGPILPISTITKGSTVITNGAADPMHGDDGDTTMAYDSLSDVVYLLVNTSRESANYYGFRLWSSTDKGQSFDPINMDVPGKDNGGNHLVSSSDKPMIKVNSTNLYVCGVGTVSNASSVWAACSTNQGTNWTFFQQLDTTGDIDGSDIAIVPDGTVYVFWLRNLGTANQFRYAWLSTNHIWSYPTNFGPQLNSTNVNGRGNPFRFNGTDPADYFWDNAFPRVAYANGNIYIAYADLPTTNNGTTDRGDIFLLEGSINLGNHWLTLTSGPRRVNNDSTQTDQWNPSIAANPSGSELFIGYYSRQNDPNTNQWIKAYGAKAFITNGLSLATFECIPISPTSFLPLFAGTNASNDTWAFDPVWPQHRVCLDTNAAYAGSNSCSPANCPPSTYVSTLNTYVNFCADDYTWCSSDSNYFYFAWCDRSRTNGVSPQARPDADIKLAKVKP